MFDRFSVCFQEKIWFYMDFISRQPSLNEFGFRKIGERDESIDQLMPGSPFPMILYHVGHY
jgi:hypothetical protein